MDLTPFQRRSLVMQSIGLLRICSFDGVIVLNVSLSSTQVSRSLLLGTD
jgi:hypothetical protein